MADRDLPAVQPVYVSDDGVIIDPRTGAEIDDNATDAQIVSFLRWLRGAIAQAQALDRDVQRILRDRADARATTGVRGAYTFGRGARVASPDAGWTWDEPEVLAALAELYDAGDLSRDVYDRVAPERRVVDKKALAAMIVEAKPVVAKRLAGCKKAPTGERRVEV